MSNLENNTTGLEEILQAVNDLPKAGSGSGEGVPGEDGGFYIPSVSQPNADTMQMAFTPSKSDMVAVATKIITLPKGAAGHSPVIAFKDMTDGYWVSVDGEDVAFIHHGQEGSEGNGIYSIERTSGTGAAGTTDTYTITYTNELTDTFTVYNGKDGKTPVKGTDYFTETDKQELVGMVLEALPVAEGASF